MIQIKEVKMKGQNNVKVSYVDTKENGVETEYVVTSNESPRPEFIDAVFSLAPDLMRIIGIRSTEEKKADEFTRVSGCSFKHLTDGGFNAVIKGGIYVPWLDAEVALNTPVMGTKPKDGAMGVYFSDSTEHKLRKILKEAELYINGKRAQQVLFQEDSEKPRAKEIGNMKLIG